MRNSEGFNLGTIGMYQIRIKIMKGRRRNIKDDNYEEYRRV